MKKIMPEFRISSTVIRLGLTILAKSFKTLQTEKLRNSHSPSNKLRTAWPTMLIEFSDLVQGATTPVRTYYSPEEIRNANEICDIYSRLPYTREQKKITLTRARTNKSWREIAAVHGIAWEECRRTSDMVILHLVQVASLDKYKHLARQNKYSKAQINPIVETL